jgi:rhodanese-related sulfurtransferase
MWLRVRLGSPLRCSWIGVATGSRERLQGRFCRQPAKVLIICNEGYSSSLAAAALRLLGRDATDVIGVFQEWRQSDLPVVS